MATKKDASRNAGPAPRGEAQWGTAAGRVAYLVETLCQGNRSQFAEQVGVSHTAINKVVAGQPPGRKLLTAIAKSISVNGDWLLTGAGEPALRVASDSRPTGVAVARKPLLGPPQDHAADLIGMEWPHEWENLFGATQYWLLLVGDQPILREKWRGFKAGDRLLMETDRSKFPRETEICNRLAVVRFPDLAKPLKLCLVDYEQASEEHGPACLLAETFEADTGDLYEDVYQHLEDGIRHFRRPLKRIAFRGSDLIVTGDQRDDDDDERTIRHIDIVAIWLQIIHRPPRVSI